MAVVSLDWKETPPAECRQGAVTIGNFDGVHLGHAALLRETLVQAQALNGPTVALTFDPHPLEVLRPGVAPPNLTTMKSGLRLIQERGANYVLVLRTTRELLNLTPDEFFHEVILDRLDAQVLVEGVDFGFGRDRAGNVDTLRSLCQQNERKLVIVPPVQWQGNPLSSSRIRDALLAGDLEAATAMLGRPYQLEGVVQVGERRGRTLGFPTANLGDVATLVPADGVYVVRAWIGDDPWPGAANVGPNPTFGQQQRKIEVHVIDFDGDLYDQRLRVDFVQRLRAARRFAGVEDLVNQLTKDVEQARRVHSQFQSGKYAVI